MKAFDETKRLAVVNGYDPQHTGSLPLIPLCGSAIPEVLAPKTATITSARVEQVLNGIVNRLRSVAKPLLQDALGTGFESFVARAAVGALISTWGRAKLKDLLQKELSDVISG